MSDDGLIAARSNSDLVTVRPLPDTIAELNYLKERIDKFVQVFILLEANSRAVKTVVAKLEPITEQVLKVVGMIGKLTPGMVVPERWPLQDKAKRLGEMMNAVHGEMEKLRTSPQRSALMSIELETYGRGICDYFSPEVQQAIESRNKIAIAARPENMSPTVLLDHARKQSLAQIFTDFADYWRSIRDALMDLQAAVVAKMAGLERRPVLFDITLDTDESDLVQLLHDVNRRLTTKEVLSELSARGHIKADSTMKLKLARLVDKGILTNRANANPRGYGLPHWP
jgi:hypothetical protein